MQPNIPEHEDDLNNVEQRLASWLPAAEGLNTDAMLYAAGLAAGRRGRIVWPAVCVVLLAQAIGVGLWGFSERAERRALASRLNERSPSPIHSPETAVADLPAPPYVPSPNDYLQLRQRAEQDPDGWLAMSIPRGQQAIGPPPPEPAILKGGQRDGLPDL
jgi:hypothetical protein